MFDTEDAAVIQLAVGRSTPGTAVVEVGAWCGRSLAAMCEVLPANVIAYSFDNYLEESQAVEDGTAPITPQVAKNLRALVQRNFIGMGKDVRCEIQEASAAGKTYKGPPVATLFVDDHHTAEQVTANIEAWKAHLAPKCFLLFHDYYHAIYEIAVTCEKVLPALGFNFVTARGGIGIWSRGWCTTCDGSGRVLVDDHGDGVSRDCPECHP